MDDAVKRKIRRSARMLHVVTLGIILLVLVAGLVLRFAEPAFVRGYFRKPLIRASGGVVDAFGHFRRELATDLTSFLPPANPDAMVAWGAKIQTHLGQPAGIFVSEGSATTWVNVPRDMQAAADLVPALLRSDSARGSRDTLGAFERLRDRVEVDKTGYTVWTVGPLEDSLRWGAVVRFQESWRPFFEMLRKSATAIALNPVAQQLNSVLQVENVVEDATTRTGLRALLDDEVVYRTPGLDSTHRMHPVQIGGYARLEYYLSDEDQRAMDYFLATGLSWFRLFLLAIFGVVVHLFWRWVRALTAPD